MDKNKKRVTAMERTRVKKPSADKLLKLRQKEQEKSEQNKQKLAARQNENRNKIIMKKEAEVNRSASVTTVLPKKASTLTKNVSVNNSTRANPIRKNDNNKSKQQNTASPAPTFHIVKGMLDKRRKKSVLFFSFVAALIIFLLVLNYILPVGLIESSKIMFAGIGSSGKMPVSIPSSSTTMLKTCGTDIALLSDSSLTLYNNNGGILFEHQHGYQNPVLCTSSSRMLIYERGGTRLRIENRAETLYDITTDQNIITADLASNGSFAVATDSSGYTCEADVYNADGKKSYVWHSADQYIVSLSLSENGRYLAVGTLSAVNGEYQSTVLIFDIKSTEPLVRQNYEGSIPISVDYKNDSVIAVFDNKIAAIKRNGTNTEQAYDDLTLSCCDNSDQNGTALVLNRYSDEQNNVLIFYDVTLNKLCEVDITSTVTSVATANNHIAVLSKQQLFSYNKNGELTGTSTLDYEPVSLAVDGVKAIFTGASLLDSVKMRNKS